MTALPYPVCRCGHRYDHHRDPNDPRTGGCYRCACWRYMPADTAETVTAQAGIGGSEPDRDDGDTMGHTE